LPIRALWFERLTDWFDCTKRVILASLHIRGGHHKPDSRLHEDCAKYFSSPLVDRRSV